MTSLEPRARRTPIAVAVAMFTLLALVVPVGAAQAAEIVDASLSDLRPGPSTVEGTLIIRGTSDRAVDPKSVTATLGGESVPVTVTPTAKKTRTTMLVIDTSGSMGASGMATVRAGVKDFLAAVPDDVRVGVVSFASTSGVDVKPTTDRAAVQRAVNGLRATRRDVAVRRGAGRGRGARHGG